MNTRHIDAIARAVLYEGYMLYPYRPSSVKNRQRFNFGVLYPRSYSEAQTGADAWSAQTGCVIAGNNSAAVEVRVRFLKLVARSVRQLNPPATNGGPAVFENVSRLVVDGKVFAPWQEAVECEVAVPAHDLAALAATPVELQFSFASKEELGPLRDPNRGVVGMIARKQESVQGVVEVSATRAGDGIFQLQVRVKNLTALDFEAGRDGRDPAMMRSLVSAHIVLGATNAQFVSLLEPPGNLKELAAGCENVGLWPVLVGAPGERDTMLASPIILYDYPEIAPESPGDLFDGAEIDEILTLRIMTMTDGEKQEMRETDERARQMLERTESLPMEHLMKLHGTLREPRPLKEDMP